MNTLNPGNKGNVLWIYIWMPLIKQGFLQTSHFETSRNLTNDQLIPFAMHIQDAYTGIRLQLFP
jgi:hypothetical protein